MSRIQVPQQGHPRLGGGFCFAPFRIVARWYRVDAITLMAMTLRRSEKLDAELDMIAETQGISKQQLIVSAIEDYLERNFHEREYDEAFEPMMKRHAGVIDRLRET